MEILTKEEFKNKWEIIRRRIKKEPLVFIYPTDTIYGIGCNATDKIAVEKVREIKKRYDKPFSIIAPNNDWIKNNCKTSKKSDEWLEKLPGPYTFIFQLKNKEAVAHNVSFEVNLGVRIPKNWFSKIVKELDSPFVTTSVNKTGEDFMKSIDDLDEEIKKQVDFIIYDGEINGKPSTIVNFIDNKIK
mgnify:FL=1